MLDLFLDYLERLPTLPPHDLLFFITLKPRVE